MLPYFHPYNQGGLADSTDVLDTSPHVSALDGRPGQRLQITQIYEGTNQVKRMVIARNLLQ